MIRSCTGSSSLTPLIGSKIGACRRGRSLICNAEDSSTFADPQPSRSARSTHGKPDAARFPACRKLPPLVPSSPHPRLPFHDRPIKPTKWFRSSHLWRGEESASFFRTLSSRAVRLNRYTANRRQHGWCRKTSPLVPPSPTPQLPTPFDDRQTDRQTDPPTDPPIKPTTRFGSSRHSSATFAEAHGAGVDRFDRRPGLNLLPTWPTSRPPSPNLSVSASFDQTTVVASDVPQAWALARTGTYFPLSVTVPKHFPEDSALTGGCSQ